MVRTQDRLQRQLRITRAYLAGRSISDIAESENVSEHLVRHNLREAGELRRAEPTTTPTQVSGRANVACLSGAQGECTIVTYPSRAAAVEAASQRCDDDRRCIGVHVVVIHDGRRYRVQSLGASPGRARQQLVAREEERHRDKLERQRRGHAATAASNQPDSNAAPPEPAGACSGSHQAGERDTADQTRCGHWRVKNASRVRSKVRRQRFRRRRRR